MVDLTLQAADGATVVRSSRAVSELLLVPSHLQL